MTGYPQPDGEPSHSAPGCELALIVAGMVMCAILSMGLGILIMFMVQEVIK